LPSTFSRDGEIENVVDQLEGDAQVPGVLAQPRFGGFVRAAHHRAQARAGGKQAGGFAVDQLHVVGFGNVDLADALQLRAARLRPSSA
jgi:hypothetical protein